MKKNFLLNNLSFKIFLIIFLVGAFSCKNFDYTVYSKGVIVNSQNVNSRCILIEKGKKNLINSFMITEENFFDIIYDPNNQFDKEIKDKISDLDPKKKYILLQRFYPNELCDLEFPNDSFYSNKNLLKVLVKYKYNFICFSSNTSNGSILFLINPQEDYKEFLLPSANPKFEKTSCSIRYILNKDLVENSIVVRSGINESYREVY
ncbi:MAG: hypothetical protein SFU98_05565 [Leptospiraceae bacterium]|nr:hypothetical protein [Leptospiraceae bacterium]